MTPPSFDVAGPLPHGLTALDASAGTGKTYALAALAVRYVAERGVPASALCIVTFTEAATAELRGRVRTRLVEALEHLDSGAVNTDDPVLAAVAACDPDERVRRATNLRAAVADFDAATITTIHGFCARVVAGAGLAVAGDVRITDGEADLAEVVNDVYLATFGPGGDTTITLDRLQQGVRARLAMPDASLWRPDPTGGSAKTAEPRDRLASGVAADLVDECHSRIVRDRRDRRRRTFDGLLTEARGVLRSPNGPAVVSTLRARYQVVLIDEFQDTDRVQWDVFRTAFVDGADPASVVIVGDPKQAIYRFRAAELSAYLAARARADHSATLGTNWRSDAPFLRALERLFAGFTFGRPDVAFHAVDAAPDHQDASLHGAGDGSFEIRCLGGDGPGPVPLGRRAVRSDVVRVVRRLLAPGVTVSGRQGERELCARDIAILTRSNADATQLALDLGAAGVPAATASSNSVFDSMAARQWEVLLLALERPNSPTAAKAAAIGWFLGWKPERVAALDDIQLAELHEQLREWSITLARRGVSELVALARAEGLNGRLLATQGGERHLTDLEHVGEILQRASGGRPASAAALLQVMADVVDGRGDEAIAPEALARRIDRDDDAVQVLTVHKAKGLEFPVVLCPYLWTPKPNASGVPHGDHEGSRVLDSSWIANADDRKWNEWLRVLHRDENDGEARRLMYVALTRAQHRCIVWWSRLGRGSSQLCELLTNACGGVAPHGAPGLAPLLADCPDVAVVAVGDDAGAHVAEPVEAPLPELDVAVADLQLDHAWRIWSFTALTSGAQLRSSGEHVDDLPGTGYIPPTGGADEPEDHTPGAAEPVVPATALADAPGGTAFGTLVHDVLEQVDFAGDDLRAELDQRCAEALAYRPMRITAAALAHGLHDAIEAPLGGPLGALRLRDLSQPDRLDELGFDLPLGRLRADRIGAVLAEHLPPGDPLVPWARGLARHGFDLEVTGALTGSIDLVARVRPADGGAPRYWVADYKTNQLAFATGYAPADLVAAMEHHHYPLQAVLYLVALHRYLRWRLPGTRAAEHIGGAGYLFLRGMDPRRAADDAHGVFWWQPGADAIEAVDALLAEGAQEAA